MCRAIRIVLLLGLVTALGSPAASGQQYRGHLRGQIVDPTGAPAAGVVMRITSETTGESRRFVAGPDGFYAVADLMPGFYRIDAEDDRYPAFAVRTAVAIGHDAHLTMFLGVASVTMTADARPTHIPVDRFSPAVTRRFAMDFLQRLPLESRDYLDAAALTAGVVPGASSVVAAGTGEHLTAYLVDGLPWFADPRLGSPPTRMPLDAITEMEVRSSTYDASFGRSAGAQVSIATRSGTSRPEGGGYGLLQPDGERALFGGFGGGALVPARTFGFASYQWAAVDGREGDGHLLSGRADHLLASSRLSGRYALDTTSGAGYGQNAGFALHTAGARPWTHEIRLGVSSVSTSAAQILLNDYKASTLQLSSAATYTQGRHLFKAGLDWYSHSREFVATERSANVIGLFVQDDWWMRPDLSVSAGVRFDHASPETENGGSNRVSPRLGVTWVADQEAKTLVRAGYGLAYNHLLVDGPPPRLDQWSLSVRRHLGRARALEAAYVGSRGEDILAGTGSSRYNALQLTLEERSEANIAALVTYTYGKWTEDLGFFDDPIRAPRDARHRGTAAFVAALPFGDERRWFDDGLAADILGNLQVTGIFRLESGTPIAGRPLEQGESLRTIDAALVKTVWLGLRRTLELRLEAYNLTDREPSPRGRRYQFGGRVVF